MQNPEAREPDNAAAAAMREIQAMRGANTVLRTVENAPPPLTDEEIMADFERTTGVKIDANGNAIGGEMKSMEQLRKEREEVERMEAGVGPVMEFSPSSVILESLEPLEALGTTEVRAWIRNGVSLDRNVVIVDGEEYEMTEGEIQGVVVFTDGVMARVLLDRRKARLEAAGITVNVEGQGDGTTAKMPDMSSGQADVGVPKGPKPKKR